MDPKVQFEITVNRFSKSLFKADESFADFARSIEKAKRIGDMYGIGVDLFRKRLRDLSTATRICGKEPDWLIQDDVFQDFNLYCLRDIKVVLNAETIRRILISTEKPHGSITIYQMLEFGNEKMYQLQALPPSESKNKDRYGGMHKNTSKRNIRR